MQSLHLVTTTAGTSLNVTNVSPSIDDNYDYDNDITTKIITSDSYVMQKTSYDSNTNITFPGGITYEAVPGYIHCYSTKNGVKQSVTAKSNVSWLSVVENNDLPYDGANYNFLFTPTENTSQSSRTGTITITQSGSNKTVIWTIVQAGKICQESTIWTSISVTNVSASKCDTNATMTVTATGVKTNTNCKTEDRKSVV